MASANSKTSMLSVLHNLYLMITLASSSYLLISADAARILQQESPIHTDEFGLGTTLTLTPDQGSFIITVGLGTPRHDFDLLFDTGSDTSWVKCNSSSGASSADSSFNPSLSLTSSAVSCGTNCNYAVDYHDGSQSSGVYANDTLSLDALVNKGFIFGCAEKSVGEFGRAVGVLGLGHGYFSLLAQTDATLLGLFCYCLPLTDSSTGSLWFGVQAMETCRPQSPSAKMISLDIHPNNNNGLTNYFVKFTGITIGRRRLDFASLLPPSSSSQMNTIIDSGTIVTRLPMAVYTELRAAFRGLMSGFVEAERTKLLDSCYNLEGVLESDWSPPEMMLHFEDSVDVKLDPSAVVLKEGDENPMSRVCLAFAGNGNEGDLTIVGNQQHRGLKVYYDINAKKLAFNSGGCSSF